MKIIDAIEKYMNEGRDIDVLRFQINEIVEDFAESYIQMLTEDDFKQLKKMSEGKAMMMHSRMHLVLNQLLDLDADEQLTDKDGELASPLFFGEWLGANYGLNHHMSIEEYKGVSVDIKG